MIARIKSFLIITGILLVLLLVLVLLALHYGGPALLAGILAGAILLRFTWWALGPRHNLPGNRARSQRIRIRLRLHPGRGHATRFELWRHWGKRAAFRRSGSIRPSLSREERRKHPETHSVHVGSAHHGADVWIPDEEHLLFMAPPRTYKSGSVASIISRYPGPVLSTSTRADIFELCSGFRAAMGKVDTFNPQGIGGYASTIRWDPVAGCEDPATAIRRADAFTSAVQTKGMEGGDFWSGKAADYMRAWFMAAACVGGDLRLVTNWALGANMDDPERILAEVGAVQWALQLRELRGENQKTAGTIKMVCTHALSFMTDPALAVSALPTDDPFDIPSFLTECGSLFMMATADQEDSPVAPLFAALAAEVRYQEKLLGSTSATGRLDPPCLFALDEITQTCPVPLPVWLADAAGFGLQIIAVVHGWAQMADRWGEHGAQVVMDTCVRMFLPGISDVRTLDAVVTQCGQVQLGDKAEDVMTAAMVRQLPRKFALIVRAGLSPVIVRLPIAWEQKPYKRARKAGTAVAALTPAPAPRALSLPREALSPSVPPGGDMDEEPEAESATARPWHRRAS